MMNKTRSLVTLEESERLELERLLGGKSDHVAARLLGVSTATIASVRDPHGRTTPETLAKVRQKLADTSWLNAPARHQAAVGQRLARHLEKVGILNGIIAACGEVMAGMQEGAELEEDAEDVEAALAWAHRMRKLAGLKSSS
jgi:hypothetical protein